MLSKENENYYSEYKNSCNVQMGSQRLCLFNKLTIESKFNHRVQLRLQRLREGSPGFNAPRLDPCLAQTSQHAQGVPAPNSGPAIPTYQMMEREVLCLHHF